MSLSEISGSKGLSCYLSKGATKMKNKIFSRQPFPDQGLGLEVKVFFSEEISNLIVLLLYSTHAVYLDTSGNTSLDLNLES